MEKNAVNEVLKMPKADAFEGDLTEALEQAGDVGFVGVVKIDIDGLLPINEQFSHAEGDRVIIETGQYLRENAPQGVQVYRYAGDEFGMIFPGEMEMEKEDVFLFMERIRSTFPVKRPGGDPLTISIGIAAAPEDGVRYHELVRKADGAMYRGKANGGSRVSLAREEKMVTKTSHYTVEQLQRLTKLSKREGIGEAILLREALDALLKKYDV